MKFLGLRIREPKSEYLDATKPIDHIRQLPDAPKRKNRSIEDGLDRQESDGSLPSSGVSSQENADSSTPIIARTIEDLRDVIGGAGSSASNLECVLLIL